MKELIAKIAVETIRPNRWILGFNGHKSNPQFGLPPGWTSPPSCRLISDQEEAQQRNCNRCGVCEFLLGDIEDSPSKKSNHIGIPPSNISPSKISSWSHISPSCNVCEFLLGDIEDSPSKKSNHIGIPPSNISPSKTSSWSHISPSKDSPSKKHRNWGEGNGTIHWRTITKNGKDYPQAYYHWKENGKKRTKYIPKQLLGVIQEAEEQKRPVIEILGLLGVVPNDSNEELLVGIENSPSTDDKQWLPTSKNSPSNDGEQLSATTSKNSPSKTRRDKGLGTGGIQWKTITLNGKDYPQAWYHYEFWQDGDRLVKKSKYIPKRLLTRIQELEAEKTPVKEILKLFRVKL
ncbi:MAG: hypothetical protein DSM106950_35290 [Stigonema ocellatum SAG 48.90 = DSM 106950]|nr:hypothetical protein [Stigonema ocellatum SAG 48.90 = DSM 106950]